MEAFGRRQIRKSEERPLVPTMANIIFLGMNTVEMSHAAGQICIRGLKQQMVMGWHQTIGCHVDIEQICGLLE